VRPSNIQDAIQKKYGEAAELAAWGGRSCCGTGPVLESGCDPITSDLYDEAQAGEVPAEALRASLGCGNPTALAQLNPGEVVLDLGRVSEQYSLAVQLRRARRLGAPIRTGRFRLASGSPSRYPPLRRRGGC